MFSYILWDILHVFSSQIKNKILKWNKKKILGLDKLFFYTSWVMRLMWVMCIAASCIQQEYICSCFICILEEICFHGGVLNSNLNKAYEFAYFIYNLCYHMCIHKDKFNIETLFTSTFSFNGTLDTDIFSWLEILRRL